MIYLPTGPETSNQFYGTTIEATPNQLIEALGEITHLKSGDHKASLIWDRELDDANMFSIYAWKYYRDIDPNEKIVWNIGARTKEIAEQAKKEILTILK